MKNDITTNLEAQVMNLNSQLEHKFNESLNGNMGQTEKKVENDSLLFIQKQIQELISLYRRPSTEGNHTIEIIGSVEGKLNHPKKYFDNLQETQTQEIQTQLNPRDIKHFIDHPTKMDYNSNGDKVASACQEYPYKDSIGSFLDDEYDCISSIHH